MKDEISKEYEKIRNECNNYWMACENILADIHNKIFSILEISTMVHLRHINMKHVFNKHARTMGGYITLINNCVDLDAFGKYFDKNLLKEVKDNRNTTLHLKFKPETNNNAPIIKYNESDLKYIKKSLENAKKLWPLLNNLLCYFEKIEDTVSYDRYIIDLYYSHEWTCFNAPKTSYNEENEWQDELEAMIDLKYKDLNWE